MLEPLLARYPQLRYGYLIELKYLRRGDRADEEAVSSLVGEASAQLRGYLADPRLARQYPGVRFIGLALVFHGWEQVYCEEVVSVAA